MTQLKGSVWSYFTSYVLLTDSCTGAQWDYNVLTDYWIQYSTFIIRIPIIIEYRSAASALMHHVVCKVYKVIK